LLAYVPAPEFARMSQGQRVEKLRSSRKQLLIALREATGAQRFDDIIESEYTQLPDEACRFLLLIVGFATLARTGISRELAREAFEFLGLPRRFEDAMDALEGIVVLNSRTLCSPHF
jgi:hypothetical protein